MSPLSTLRATVGKPIPDGWAECHRPAAEATMTATCDIYPAPSSTQSGTWNPATHSYGPATNTDPVATDVPCRVQQQDTRSEADDTPAGTQDTHAYLVTMPAMLNPQRGSRLKVTTSDPGCPQVWLTVTNTKTGSLVWERDLLCVEEPSEEVPDDG